MSQVLPKHREVRNEICGGLESEEKVVLIENLKKLGYHAQDM